MSEELSHGADEATEVALNEASGKAESVTADGMMTKAEVDALLAEREKQINELRSSLDKRYSRDVGALQERLDGLSRTLTETTRQTLGDEAAQRLAVNQPDAKTERIWRTGALFTEAEDRFPEIPVDRIRELSKTPGIGPHNYIDILEREVTNLRQESQQTEFKNEMQSIRDEIKNLLKREEEVSKAADEKVRQVRKEVGADRIPTGAPEPGAPSEEAKVEYLKSYRELLKEKGDRRGKLRALDNKFQSEFGLSAEDIRRLRG